jgi:predicted chitinase
VFLPNIQNSFPQPYYSPMGTSLSSQQTMSTLNALIQMVMAMMNGQLSGQGGAPFPAQRSPGFGSGEGCSCSGGPGALGNFLGQGGPSRSTPGSLRSANPSGHSRATPPTGATNYPTGDVGNANVSALVNALPASRRRAASQHFPNILAEANRQGVSDPAQLAYILATSVHESGAGAHMEEFASGRAYEGRRGLGNTQSGDGPRYKGRGYVQITGRRNYTDWSRRLGMDLVGNPDLAKDPRIASRILVEGMMRGTFTGRSLGSYVGNGSADFHNARRVVNGTDHAASIANTAQRLMAAIS